MSELKQIKLSEVKADIEAGMKRDALRTKYGITNTELNAVLQAGGLRIKQYRHPKIEIVNDLVSAGIESVQDRVVGIPDSPTPRPENETANNN